MTKCKKAIITSQMPILAGQPIRQDFKEGLQKANLKFTKSKNHSDYIKAICELSHREKFVKQDEKYKLFLGGFVLGEGSINVSAKKGKDSPHGIYLDLEFSVTQHSNRLSQLIGLLRLFKTGRLRHKGGSLATLVFTMSDRTALWEKVVPYWQKYILPYSLDRETLERFQSFLSLLISFREGHHKRQDTFCEIMLPLWDKMRKQKGQSNESFSSLDEAISYVKTYKKVT